MKCRVRYQVKKMIRSSSTSVECRVGGFDRFLMPLAMNLSFSLARICSRRSNLVKSTLYDS